MNLSKESFETIEAAEKEFQASFGNIKSVIKGLLSSYSKPINLHVSSNYISAADENGKYGASGKSITIWIEGDKKIGSEFDLTFWVNNPIFELIVNWDEKEITLDSQFISNYGSSGNFQLIKLNVSSNEPFEIGLDIKELKDLEFQDVIEKITQEAIKCFISLPENVISTKH